MEFNFTCKGRARQEFSDYINDLFNEAGFRKGENPVTSEERVENAEKLTESYFSLLGEHAPPELLDRLSTYLMYDYVGDTNSHKINEDNSFHTETQERYRLESKMILKDEIVFDKKQTTGKVKGVSNEDTPNISSKKNIFKPESEETENIISEIDLEQLFKRAELSQAEKSVIVLRYVKNLRVIDISEKMKLNESTIRTYERRAIQKLAKFKKDLAFL